MTPFKGPIKVTSPFGPRTHPITGAPNSPHNGIDMTDTKGNWTIRECTGGTVVETSAAYNYGRGWLVRVQCGNAVETYQHLASIAVKKGQVLAQGDTIGVAGTTGDSTGVHLHFEVTIGGVAVNPSEWCDVPNAKGTYDGNDNVDAPAPTPAPSGPFPGVSDEQLAARVWAGEFGNGDARKAALGTRYAAVQALVDKGVGKPTPAPSVGVGSTVRLNSGAKFYDGTPPYDFVYNRNHVVSELSGDRAVITYNGTVVGAVRLSDLALVQ